MPGEYEILVLGTLATQNYALTVEATEYQRGLNPDETLALGQVPALTAYVLCGSSCTVHRLSWSSACSRPPPP